VNRLTATLLVALPPLLMLLALLGAWQAYVEASGISAVTLPSPTRVLEALWRGRDVISRHSWVTLKETLYGLGAALALGVALALIIDAFSPLRRAVYPLIVGSQTIPIVVIAPLLVIWFGFGLLPKVLVVTLYTFFPITVALAQGLAATDHEALLLMQTLGADRLQTLRLLKLPQALPYLFTGLKITVTYAMVGAVFAEWNGATEGLGLYVILMKNSFRTDMVFAAVVVIALLSLGLFVLVGLIERLVVRWK
jgi:ABC-type nitrate/sulfonate/bicarbonate transport system permease component